MKEHPHCTCREFKHNLINFNIKHVQLEPEHGIKQRREVENSVHTVYNKKRNKNPPKLKTYDNLVLLKSQVVHNEHLKGKVTLNSTGQKKIL